MTQDYYQSNKVYLRNWIIPIILLCLSMYGCNSSDKSSKTEDEVLEIVPQIIRSIPHDTLAFTQGLLYHDHKIIESTGRYGQSSLRIINSENGTMEHNIAVKTIFAEGLALKNNMLIQLTWKSGFAFRYTLLDLKLLDTLFYHGEGWGLTTDENVFIMSNGSDSLYIRSDDFSLQKIIPVTLKGKPVSNINELEYARNKVYANIWYNDYIYEIDPNTGLVLRLINCQILVNKIPSLKTDEVLNGIAYNKSKDTFFCTGKNWPLIFEVRIPPQ